MSSGTVLVVDDEVLFARSQADLLRRNGFEAFAAHTADEARRAVAERAPEVVLTDLHLPDANGAELMVELKRDFPHVQFIIITAHGSIRSAVESTRSGAVDYLTKPLEPDVVLLAVRKAMRALVVNAEVQRLRMGPHRHARDSDDGPYRSVAMQRLMQQAHVAAHQEGIVLLLGESGSGKDHLARWIHERSRRASGPFFSINCAAVSPQLAESELFGHEPGAFTGTRGRKRGLLELAESGTLLLDEVGELPLALQSKLLTFLDTRTFLRVGGERPVRVDARLFAATNRDLRQEVDEGRFRKDLYYRLHVFPVEVPPLRERGSDIPRFVSSLLARLAKELSLPNVPVVEDDAMDQLQRYSWPGNVRELRNVLERGLMVSGGTRIRAVDLALEVRNDFRYVSQFPVAGTLHDATKELARALIAEALRRGRSKSEAARLLGLSRHAFAYQLRTLGLEE